MKVDSAFQCEWSGFLPFAGFCQKYAPFSINPLRHNHLILQLLKNNVLCNAYRRAFQALHALFLKSSCRNPHMAGNHSIPIEKQNPPSQVDLNFKVREGHTNSKIADLQAQCSANPLEIYCLAHGRTCAFLKWHICMYSI